MTTEAIRDVASDLVDIARHWTNQMLPTRLPDTTHTRLTGATYSLLAHVQDESWIDYMALSPKDDPNVVIGSGRTSDERISAVFPDQSLISHGLQDLDPLKCLLTEQRELELLDRLREITDYHADGAQRHEPLTTTIGWWMTDVLAMIHRHYTLRLTGGTYYGPDRTSDIAPFLAATFAARWAEYQHGQAAGRRVSVPATFAVVGPGQSP